jgi:hypothetical protein
LTGQAAIADRGWPPAKGASAPKEHKDRNTLKASGTKRNYLQTLSFWLFSFDSNCRDMQIATAKAAAAGCAVL